MAKQYNTNVLLDSITVSKISNTITTAGLERVRNNGRYDLVKNLEKFPDNYHIIYELPLKVEEGYESTLEAVVIGPSGIHVLGYSCKHGDMVGNKKDNTWVQHIVSRSGYPYTNKFKNPTRFLMFQQNVVKRFFRKHGINLFIDGCYMFLNAKSIETDCQNRCFCNFDNLIEFITNKNTCLSDVQIQYLVRLLGYDPQ